MRTQAHRHLHTTTAYSELAVGLFRNNAPGLGEEGGRELGESEWQVVSGLGAWGMS